MNREALKELGLTDEQIDKVMASHGQVVNATKDSLNSVTTERDDLKTQLMGRDTQLEELKVKATGNEALLTQIEELKTTNATATTELQSKLDQQAFDFNLEKALTGAKVRNPKAVKALLDTESIKLDGEKLLGLDDQIKALQESDAYLFESEQNEEPPKPSFTTGQHSKDTKFTKEDLNKLSYKDRLKLKQDNPEQYKTLTGQ